MKNTEQLLEAAEDFFKSVDSPPGFQKWLEDGIRLGMITGFSYSLDVMSVHGGRSIILALQTETTTMPLTLKKP